MIRFTVLGNPATKKNSSRIIYNKRIGRSMIIPSEVYTRYAKVFISQVPVDYRIGINKPIIARYLYYMQTRRIVDLVGLEQATNDLLVTAGVLQDDNSRIVRSHDGSRVFYDKDNPRVEIQLIPIGKD